MAERIQRLEKAIDVAIDKGPPEMRAVMEALQSCAGWRACVTSKSFA
jgi:hypothetical protein